MQPPVDEPDFLDTSVRLWAEEYEDLLELIAHEVRRTGEWPTVSRLTRQLAREGRAVPVMMILGSMPRALGFTENYPGRIVLLLFGLRLTRAGHPLVVGFWEALEIAIERYRGDDEEPKLTRADIARTWAPDDPYVRALSEVVLREAPFLGSGAGGPDEEWTREITDDIVRYWDSTSPEDYLRVRAAEFSPRRPLSLYPTEGQGCNRRWTCLPTTEQTRPALTESEKSLSHTRARTRTQLRAPSPRSSVVEATVSSNCQELWIDRLRCVRRRPSRPASWFRPR
jgi:hypothetical protein